MWKKIVVRESVTFLYHVKQLIYIVWEHIVCRYLDDNNITGTLHLEVPPVGLYQMLTEVSLTNNQITSANYYGGLVPVRMIHTIIK